MQTFSKGISPKVNVTVWLGFELIYYEGTVLYLTIKSQGILPNHVRFWVYGTYGTTVCGI